MSVLMIISFIAANFSFFSFKTDLLRFSNSELSATLSTMVGKLTKLGKSDGKELLSSEESYTK